jgi:hypothetical protein
MIDENKIKEKQRINNYMIYKTRMLYMQNKIE